MYLGLVFFNDISCHKTGTGLIPCATLFFRISPLPRLWIDNIRELDCTLVSWGSSVGLVTKIRVSPKLQDRLCGPPLCSGMVCYPVIKRPERQPDHSSSSSAEVKNKWSSASTFMAYTSEKFTFYILPLLYIPNFGSRWNSVVMFTPQPLYLRGESSRYWLNGKLGWPQKEFGRFGDK